VQRRAIFFSAAYNLYTNGIARQAKLCNHRTSGQPCPLLFSLAKSKSLSVGAILSMVRQLLVEEPKCLQRETSGVRLRGGHLELHDARVIRITSVRAGRPD
jgi:hypothetical protein